MESFSPFDRARFYTQEFPDYPPLRADDRWLDGIWIMGNNYRGSGLYGAYPPKYLARVLALFPDRRRTLHLCSGSLAHPRPQERPRLSEVTLDLRREIAVTSKNAAGLAETRLVSPMVQSDAQRLPFLPGAFDLVLGDPPYGPDDADRYGTPMLDKRQVFRAVSQVVEPGGHFVWLDTSHPMFSRTHWHWWGVIGIVRSTNHRYRMATIFRRAA